MSNQVTIACFQLLGYYSIVVPTGYSTTINYDLTGGGGGAGYSFYGANGEQGGNGDRIIGTFTANPGDEIDVYIGGGGGTGTYGVGGVLLSGGLGGSACIIGSGVNNGTTVWYPVSLSYAWSGFMNTYAVWVNSNEVDPVGSWVSSTRTFYVASAGQYYTQCQADNHLNFYIDGRLISQSNDFQNTTYVPTYLNVGYHTLQFDALNDGGPAGFAVTIASGDYSDNGGNVVWDTRTGIPLGTNPKYAFYGGNGGFTIGDGSYTYNSPGGGGGASAIFLNGVPIVVAGGGGGGGAQGGHGDAGGAGGGGGGAYSTNPAGYPGYGVGQNGINDEDDYLYGSGGAGTPGGGGGWIGGATTPTVNYDDAPSNGAYGGTSLVPPGSSNGNAISYYGSGGTNSSNGVSGYGLLTFTQLGTGKVKVNGQWKQIDDTFVKVGGQWKRVDQAWTKVDGEWKIISGGVPVTSSFIVGNSAGQSIVSAYIPGVGEGGGGPAAQTGGNVNGYSTENIAIVSTHYQDSYGTDFTANKCLAFVNPNTTLTANDLAGMGYDPSDVRRAENIILTGFSAGVDSYLELGYAFYGPGADPSNWYGKTSVYAYSDPQGDRHFHNDGALSAQIASTIGTNQLLFIYLYDGSGSNGINISIQIDDYGAF